MSFLIEKKNQKFTAIKNGGEVKFIKKNWNKCLNVGEHRDVARAS